MSETQSRSLILQGLPFDDNVKHCTKIADLCESVFSGGDPKVESVVFPVDAVTVHAGGIHETVAVVTFHDAEDAEAFRHKASQIDTSTLALPKQLFHVGTLSIEPGVYGVKDAIFEICNSFRLSVSDRSDYISVGGEWFRVQALCNILYKRCSTEKDQLQIAATPSVDFTHINKEDLEGHDKMNNSQDKSVHNSAPEQHIVELPREKVNSSPNEYSVVNVSKQKTACSSSYSKLVSVPTVVINHILKEENNAVLQIENKYNVKIRCEEGTCRIEGDQKKVEQAEKRVHEAVQLFDGLVENIPLQPGKSELRGNKIAKVLQEKYPQTTVSYDEKDDLLWVVVKERRQLSQCVDFVQSMVDDKQNEHDSIVQVEWFLVRYIWNFCDIEKLWEKFHVQIELFYDVDAKHTSPTDMVTVYINGRSFSKATKALGNVVDECRSKVHFQEIACTFDDQFVTAIVKKFKQKIIIEVDARGKTIVIGPHAYIKEATDNLKKYIPEAKKRTRILADSAKKTSSRAGVKSQSQPLDSAQQALQYCAKETDPPQPHSFRVRNSTTVVHSLLYDITTMGVDVIVNAANERLQHGAGVARAIADAAGYALEEDCDKYINLCGELKVTEIYVSTAGDLSCKSVMHAVGPRYNNAFHEDCCKELFDTVVNCLKIASSKNFKSIAIPAISSGIFGFPNNMVGKIIIGAVARFLTVTEHTPLSDIYLVDIRPDIITMYNENIQSIDAFESCAFIQKTEHFPQKSLVVHSADITTSDGDAVSTFDGSYRRRKAQHSATVGCVVGTQPPNGTMDVRSIRKEALPGFEGYGIIEITYVFPGGVQSGEHPCPGRRYEGVTRIAYLPLINEGLEVLDLLQKAFSARLLFRIGRPTRGQADTVLWADIEHKTQTQGGKDSHGYPDPHYLRRVKKQLEDKGLRLS